MNSPPWSIDPARTALVNIDLQNVFVEGYKVSAPDGLEIVARMNRLSHACRTSDIAVVHTRAVQRDHGLTDGPIADLLAEFRVHANYSMVNGDPATELHPDLVVEEGDVVLEKPRYSAFTNTDLDLILRRKDINTLIIAGIATNVCVDSTVREAAMMNYRVIVPGDVCSGGGVAGYSNEQVHDMTLGTLGRYFAEVTDLEALLKRMPS